MCVCMCVCMYVCMYVCVCMCVYVCVCIIICIRYYIYNIYNTKLDRLIYYTYINICNT